MLELYLKYHQVIMRFRRGSLGNEIDCIAARLWDDGYKCASAKLYLARIARFSAYATRCGCSKSVPIPPGIVDHYLRGIPTIAARWGAQGAIGYAARSFPERFARRPLPTDPDGPLIADYLQHLRGIRGLHPKTCEGLALTARKMLAWHKAQSPAQPLGKLTAQHVLTMTQALLSMCRTDGSRSSMTAHMRSFLRYLHWASHNICDLSSFVPKTPCWRHAHLPPHLPWPDVLRAIDSIETTTSSGIRDRAMMLLLATTGLRNRELRQIDLGDIRWRTGELVLRHTKGHRDRIVPLLQDTGAALAEYVLHARPQTMHRILFLSHVPPVRPFSRSGTVSRIVRTRLELAGISLQRGGAHLLRHSLASRLVEQRRPIKEVADLLGHRNIDTTAIYVKVAVPQLADVALPFPGGAS